MSDKVFIAPRVAGAKCPLAPEDSINGRRHVAPQGEVVPDRIFYERLERDGSLFRGANESDVARQRAAHEEQARADEEKRARARAAKGDQ